MDALNCLWNTENHVRIEYVKPQYSRSLSLETHYKMGVLRNRNNFKLKI